MNSNEFVLLFGAGGHSKVIVDILFERNIFNIYRVDKENVSPYLEVKTISVDKAETLMTDGAKFIVSIGDNTIRKNVYDSLFPKYSAYKHISSHSCNVSSTAQIGLGTVLMSNSSVNSDTQIGHNCIINTNASLDHDCHIGNNVHIGPGTTLAGSVTVGDNTFIGAGATVIPGVSIGPNVMVGAGSLVLENIPSNEKWFGVPAVKISRWPEVGERK